MPTCFASECETAMAESVLYGFAAAVFLQEFYSMTRQRLNGKMTAMPPNKSLEPTAGAALVLGPAPFITSHIVPGCGSALIR